MDTAHSSKNGVNGHSRGGTGPVASAISGHRAGPTHTRTEMLALTGIAMRTLRELQKKGVCKPEKVDGRYRFSDSDVQKVLYYLERRKRVPRQEPGDWDGTLAAAVFAAMDRGESASQIVVRLRCDPRTVRALFAERAECDGDLWIKKLHAEHLAILLGRQPFKNGEELLALVVKLIDEIDAAAKSKKAERERAKVAQGGGDLRITKQDAERLAVMLGRLPFETGEELFAVVGSLVDELDAAAKSKKEKN